MIFEFYEQKYFEIVYLKLILAQSIKQERSAFSCMQIFSTEQMTRIATVEHTNTITFLHSDIAHYLIVHVNSY